MLAPHLVCFTTRDVECPLCGPESQSSNPSWTVPLISSDYAKQRTVAFVANLGPVMESVETSTTNRLHLDMPTSASVPSVTVLP